MLHSVSMIAIGMTIQSSGVNYHHPPILFFCSDSIFGMETIIMNCFGKDFNMFDFPDNLSIEILGSVQFFNGLSGSRRLGVSVCGTRV